MITDGAYVAGCGLVGGQADAALTSGKLHQLGVVKGRYDLFPTDRAASLSAVGLIVDEVVTAMGTLPGDHPLGADMDGVTAVAVNFLSRKEAGLGFHIFAAIGAFHYKFRHNYLSSYLQ